VLEDHRLPVVRFRLILRAGSLFEPKPGVAEMTAAMLTEGTQNRTSLQLAQEGEDIGATVNVTAGMDMATLSGSGLSENSETLISMLADVLLHPTFPSDRLDRMKFQQTSQIGQRRANPAALTADLSAHVYYGGTAYERASARAPEIASISQDDLKSFYSTYYLPNGALLGVSGDVDLKRLKSRLEAALAEWKPGAKSVELPPADFKPKEATRIYLVDRPGSAQTVLQFGNLSLRQNDPDYIPLVVANRILGGGSAGRLFQNIREQKGYTYGAYSNLSAGRWPGLWGASASVRTPVTEPAVREFFHEFDRLQEEKVPAEELERAKRSIVGSFAGTLESPDGILTRTLDLVQNGLPLDYWDAYPARIQAVTADDIQRVAKKYLGKNRIQLIAVGEKSQIEEGLKKFGPVEEVDASQLGGAGGGGGRGRR
jgi:predicted Zn-dependent peptidase